MGMITRVRGRVRSDSFSKIDPKVAEDKIANIVWLLSLVLVLPYCTPREWLVGGARLLLAYSCAVLPVLLAANYKYPPRWLPSLRSRIRDVAHRLEGPVERAALVACAVYAPLGRLENALMQMTNISTLLCQVLFFVSCERLIISSGQRATCLYTLMLWHAAAYCASYCRDARAARWTPYVRVARHSRLQHLAMSATKLVLDWTKLVTFLITLASMVVALGVGHGLQYYRSTLCYQLLTGCYYLSTEKVFVSMWPWMLRTLRVERCDGVESLVAPAAAAGASVAAAAALGGALAWSAHARLAAALLYLACWVRARLALRPAAVALAAARGSLARFRRAPEDELARLDDVCAVCLAPMSAARATPCRHYFHAECLRRCLAASDRCPLCVRPFTFC